MDLKIFSNEKFGEVRTVLIDDQMSDAEIMAKALMIAQETINKKMS